MAACDLGLKKGCFKYDDLCYPETGYMPYKKYFGEGVQSGDRWIEFNNTQSITYALVVLKNVNTGVKVRSQFIRKGEELTIRNIPRGYYELKVFHGNAWAYDILMDDGVTKGGFTKDIKFEKDRYDLDRYESWKSTLYKVSGGNAKTEDIDFNEFMR